MTQIFQKDPKTDHFNCIYLLVQYSLNIYYELAVNLAEESVLGEIESHSALTVYSFIELFRVTATNHCWSMGCNRQ